MTEQRFGHTALGTAVCRFIEQFQPEETRLFNDSIVKDMVGTSIRALMQSARMRNFMIKRTDSIMQGIYGAQICRTRFIDDAVQTALSQGIEQLVILGAGFDTRPYRLTCMERVKAIEVDLPSAQEDKKKKLQKHFGRLPENVTFIPINFNTQSLEAVLTGTDFDPSRPVVFIWEGVTQYLLEEAVRRTLDFVSKSAPGSILVFTYILKSIIERRSDIPGADKMMDFLAKNNTPFLFGLEPSSVPSFLKPFHLNLIADVGNADYQARCLKPLGRNLVVSEGERVVQATVVRS
ncbi:MAG: SAM-dependent methyltransferase [Candidatus Freyarchaeum deiterrae]